MTEEEKIRQQLEAAAAHIALSRGHIDASTEYLEEDLEKVYAALLELMTKMDRDTVLQRDREAFAEPSAGLKEWLDGEPRQR